MKKMKLLSKVSCLVAVGGLVAGCGAEPVTESDAQPVGEVSQAIAAGKRFNALSEEGLSVANRADLQIWRPSVNTWYVRRTHDGGATSFILARATAAEDVPVQGNFDGDSLYDQATFRPSTGVWLIRRSSTGAQYTVTYGQSGDIPTPGDFDGDGKTDVSVWRPSTGTFYVINSSTGAGFSKQYGQSGDMPVVGNYDGDSKDDFAVFRPSTGMWFYVRSSDSVQKEVYYGKSGDIPVLGDYDGDDKTDIALFRPTDGNWYIIRSSTGSGSAKPYGGLKDYPQPADYDGDGKTDIAIYRPSEGKHYIIYSSTNSGTSVHYGASSDVVVNTSVYCERDGRVGPCNSDNVELGEPGLVDSSSQCFTPSTYSSYSLLAPGVSETNYYAKVKFATTHADSGLMGAYDTYAYSHDREIYLRGGNICTYTYSSSSEYLCTSGVNYADGQVHTVVHTVNSTGNKLYVDGVLKQTGSLTASAFYWETQILVGYGMGSYATPAGASKYACIYHVEAR